MVFGVRYGMLHRVSFCLLALLATDSLVLLQNTFCVSMRCLVSHLVAASPAVAFSGNRSLSESIRLPQLD